MRRGELLFMNEIPVCIRDRVEGRNILILVLVTVDLKGLLLFLNQSYIFWLVHRNIENLLIGSEWDRLAPRSGFLLLGRCQLIRVLGRILTLPRRRPLPYAGRLCRRWLAFRRVQTLERCILKE
jgi:hypothetical protein